MVHLILLDEARALCMWKVVGVLFYLRVMSVLGSVGLFGYTTLVLVLMRDEIDKQTSKQNHLSKRIGKISSLENYD